MGGPGVLMVRREISGLAANDPIVTGYAQGVKRMQERHPDDPTSWSYQAAMHGSLTTPERKLWNQCQHATWYFLPWHRMFLYYFERIVRAAIVEEGGRGLDAALLELLPRPTARVPARAVPDPSGRPAARCTCPNGRPN